MEKEPGGKTYIVSGSDSNGGLEWMPAHMQNLLVVVEMFSICFFPHSTRNACASWASCSSLLATIDWSWYSNLLRFKRTLIRLENNLHFLLRIRRIYHKVIVVR